MIEVVWNTWDSSLEYKLQFIHKACRTHNSYGKAWPLHTQCVLYRNGLVEHFETIVKHAKDKNNPKHAHKKVGEMCLQTIKTKFIRNEIRELMDNAIINSNFKGTLYGNQYE